MSAPREEHEAVGRRLKPLERFLENPATNWHQHFRTWRKQRLREVEVEYGDRLDEVAEFLAEFGNKIKALGPSGYLRSTSHRAGEPVTLDDEADPPGS